MRAAVGPVSPPAAQHHLDAAPASVTGHCRVTGAGGAPFPPPPGVLQGPIEPTTPTFIELDWEKPSRRLGGAVSQPDAEFLDVVFLRLFYCG